MRPASPSTIRGADAALFPALEQTVRRTANRQLIRLPHHINDPPFAAAVVAAFRDAARPTPRAMPDR